MMQTQSMLALVLAAGSSQRFGSDKRRALLPGGTLLGASVQVVAQVVPRTIVVLRRGDDPAPLGLAPEQRVHFSDCASEGMGATLADAVDTWATPSLDAIVVALGDMPWLRADTLRTLSEAVHPDAIVRPWCNGRAGHPVIFGRSWFEDLRQLGGDEGARALLQAHPEAVCWVEVGDTGVLRDVDQPSDLAP